MTSPLLKAWEISDIHLKARIEWPNLPQPKPSLYDYQDQCVAHAQLVAAVKWMEERGTFLHYYVMGNRVFYITEQDWQALKECAQ